MTSLVVRSCLKPAVQVCPLAPVRDSDRLVVATSRTRATTPRQPPPCQFRPRATAAPLSVGRPFVFASNDSYDTEILPFASQINYVPPTKANNCPFKLEVIFCVQGALSPLLSNIVLDELDWELERRGHRFVRYADDCNILVRSVRAGQRVMASIRSFLERRTQLKVNEEKSGVRQPHEVHFLGFRFQCRPEACEMAVLLSAKSGRRLRTTVREMTPPNWGRSLAACMKELSQYLNGWGCAQPKPSKDCGRSMPTSAAVSGRSSSASGSDPASCSGT
jgi:Reverse transcriptase (RNA-dependent DNA polymerase)